MKKILTGVSIFPLALALLLTRCPVTPQDDENDPGAGAIEQRSDLFVPNVAQPGFTEFWTNDTSFSGPYGYTLWSSNGLSQQPFPGREVTAVKSSGDAWAGYGLVFCHYDTGDPALGETMLVVMINTRQEFIVGEVVGLEFQELVPWTESMALVFGYGPANIIRLEYDDGTGDFDLYLNGTHAVVFRDDDPPYHTGGADGYVVVISPQDRFPQDAVQVVFEEP